MQEVGETEIIGAGKESADAAALEAHPGRTAEVRVDCDPVPAILLGEKIGVEDIHTASPVDPKAAAEIAIAANAIAVEKTCPR